MRRGLEGTGVPIFLIRHPEPRGAGGVCYGREDLCVEPESVKAAAAAIRARIPAQVLAHAEFFSSPLSRCRVLARELGAAKPVEIAGDLAEMDFGAWEGKPWDVVPRAELEAWAADVWGYRPGGGECAHMVAARWRRWSAKVRAHGAANVVAVTHAGVIRVALAGQGRVSAAEFAGISIGFGSVHCLEFREAELSACGAP
jgi:alpha-ribazole phosphatase